MAQSQQPERGGTGAGTQRAGCRVRNNSLWVAVPGFRLRLLINWPRPCDLMKAPEGIKNLISGLCCWRIT